MTKLKVEIVKHFNKDDVDFREDYRSVEVFINGKSVRQYGDYYHEKGDICAENFADGLSFSNLVSVKLVNKADYES